jgi:hypothetical protein
MKIVIKCLGLICVGILFLSTGVAQQAGSEKLLNRLRSKIGDFRSLHSSNSDLELRVKARQCLAEVEGLVFGKSGIPVHSKTFEVGGRLTVGQVVDQMEVDIADLGGVQLRLFKRDRIQQTSRLFRNRGRDEIDEFRSIHLEPGDVMLFVAEE